MTHDMGISDELLDAYMGDPMIAAGVVAAVTAAAPIIDAKLRQQGQPGVDISGSQHRPDEDVHQHDDVTVSGDFLSGYKMTSNHPQQLGRTKRPQLNHLRKEITVYDTHGKPQKRYMRSAYTRMRITRLMLHLLGVT